MPKSFNAKKKCQGLKKGDCQRRLKTPWGIQKWGSKGSKAKNKKQKERWIKEV